MPLDELSAKRMERIEKTRYSKVGNLLREVSRAFDADMIEHRPHAAVIVLISNHGPEVAWAGYPTADELFLAADAIREAKLAMRLGNDPQEAVEAMVARRKEYEERQAQRTAEYRRTHPFECSHPHCTRRFKTQAALTRHERHTCSYFRYDREHAEGDTYHP